MQLEIHLEAQGDLPVLHPVGEVDAYTAPQLKTKIEALLHEHKTFGIWLADVTYIDSTGLSVLIFALKRTRSEGGDCYLFAPHPAVEKLLKITGLDKAFKIKTNFEEL